MRQPEQGELLLDVLACGVNFTDILFLQGAYQVPSRFPLVPGGELCGRVRAAGPGTRLSPGTRVIARTGLGGMAETVTVAEDRCLPVPDEVPDGIAAIIQFSFATAYYALTRCSRLEPGDKVLVLGAGGGVGSAAVAIARCLGANVCAAASSGEKLALLSPAPDQSVEYPASPDDEARRAFTQALKRIAPEGFHAIVDPVGGALAEPAMRAMAPSGSYLVIGFAGGIPRVPLNLPLLKAFRIVGVSWHDFLTRQPDANRRMLGELFELYRSGHLPIAPPAPIPLEEAPGILHAMVNRKLGGKCIVVPSAGPGPG